MNSNVDLKIENNSIFYFLIFIRAVYITLIRRVVGINRTINIAVCSV